MKKYKTIYADPAWQIGSIELDKWQSPLSDKYITMTDEEIQALPIKDLADIDCGLFLWVTHTKLPVGLKLMENWGFKYYCIITWDKGNGWSQHGFHKRTELLLFGYKGKISNVINQEGNFIPTIITEKKSIHSRKPKRLYGLLLNNTAEPRIELFARQRIDGFDVWGNEAPNHTQAVLSDSRLIAINRDSAESPNLKSTKILNFG